MESTIDAAVRDYLAREGITPCGLLVAVSGGADSTALLLALAELRKEAYDITAAHVNHRLRGSESDADEQFVRDACANLRVPLHVVEGPLDREQVRKRGIEAAARAIRYRLLLEIRERIGARFLATAHQQDDQAETVLMRLLAGSGLAGLRGIHPVRDDGVLRPLLDVRREEIDAFLRARGITPRHDRSNDDPRFLRNRVRRIVRELGATASLARIADRARQQWPLLERLIDDADRECVDAREGETRFHTLPENEWLRGALLQRHIRRLDPQARDYDAERIARNHSSVRRLSVTKNVELRREGDTWILRRLPQPTAPFSYELPAPGSLPIAELGASVHVHSTDRTRPAPGRQCLQLPVDHVPALTIRNRRRGDRFQPLGLASPKKLKDFLIDRKIARDSRDRLPLLVWNDEIVCVLGVEISERFKVTDPAGAIFEVWMEDARDAAPAAPFVSPVVAPVVAND